MHPNIRKMYFQVLGHTKESADQYKLETIIPNLSYVTKASNNLIHNNEFFKDLNSADTQQRAAMEKDSAKLK